MGHIPLLKDGVVNVIELDDDCACVTKAVHKEMSASEEADYRKRLDAWRQSGQARHEEIAAAKRKAFTALGVANALKVQARGESRGNGNADPFLRRILVADREAEAWRNKVAELRNAAAAKAENDPHQALVPRRRCDRRPVRRQHRRRLGR